MPAYDYECQDCGVFTSMRPMSEWQADAECPQCGHAAQRAFLTAPAIFGMPGALKKAYAINEKAAHEPRSSSAHGAGCSCCKGGGKKSSKTQTAANGAKTFPKARPWMISH